MKRRQSKANRSSSVRHNRVQILAPPVKSSQPVAELVSGSMHAKCWTHTPGHSPLSAEGNRTRKGPQTNEAASPVSARAARAPVSLTNHPPPPTPPEKQVRKPDRQPQGKGVRAHDSHVPQWKTGRWSTHGHMCGRQRKRADHEEEDRLNGQLGSEDSGMDARESFPVSDQTTSTQMHL